MTHGASTHPGLNQLAAFGLGRLDDAESASIEEHLATCRDCCESLKQTPTDDSYVQLLRDTTTLGASATDVILGTDTDAAEQPVSVNRVAGIPEALVDHPRYRVIRCVGQGGMGIVFEAEHRLMRRRVALKIIKPQWLSHPGAIARFRGEVQAAAKLIHPHIVTAFDAEQAGDLHFLVMEFVDGVTLSDLVSHGPTLPVAVACDLIREAALGLQHAHEHGLVHRDIKPGNLMAQWGVGSGEWGEKSKAVTSELPTLHSSPVTIKILDFGLARFASEGGDAGRETSANVLLGTPDFMAPEQARDARAADIRSDIYSLGCSLFVLLTGTVPYPEAGTSIDKVLAHLHSEPKPLAKFRGDVPDQLQAVLNRMIAKRPEDRFQTPGEVAAALASLRRDWDAESQLEVQRTAPAPSRLGMEMPLAAGLKRLLLAMGLVGFFLVMAVIVHVVTDKGDLRIRSELPRQRLVLRQNGQDVRVIEVPAGTTSVRLLSGEYEIELRPQTTGRRLEPSSVQIQRGRASEVSIVGMLDGKQ